MKEIQSKENFPVKFGMEMAVGNLTHALIVTNKVSHVTGTDCMGHQYFITKILVITLTVDPDPRRGQHRRGVKHRVDVGPFKDLVYS